MRSMHDAMMERDAPTRVEIVMLDARCGYSTRANTAVRVLYESEYGRARSIEETTTMALRRHTNRTHIVRHHEGLVPFLHRDESCRNSKHPSENNDDHRQRALL